MDEAAHEEKRSRRVRPGFLLAGAAALVLLCTVVLLALVAPSSDPDPDLGPLADEPIFTEVPTGGRVRTPVTIIESCESDGAYAFMAVDAPSRQSAVDFYDDLAHRGGWDVTYHEDYLKGTKQVGDRVLTVIVGFEPGETVLVTIRGDSDPNLWC